MLTLYGKRQSRAGRCFWLLEELALPYRQVPVDHTNGETRGTAHLALNPMGKVPVLVDDGFVLTESVAINHYLAAKQASPLWPNEHQAQARIQQWTSWAVTELEFHFTLLIREKRRAGAAPPDATIVAACLEAAGASLVALERHLGAGSAFVAGADFTLGDLNTASAVRVVPMFLDIAAYPATAAWLERCLSRPAWLRVQGLE